MNLAAITIPTDDALAATVITKVLIFLPKHVVELADPRAELDDGSKKG